ncbi:MAG: aminotransferase class III-fold pyridoxal phosphate-dependent enzyme [Planctomycetes bacterium]|nr:aminotransferase class III-fold pyridoxal phosphate-dependent enzyme [Planctomycetota bacterium]MCP4772097.1 aminotransferase class III-fold pyridoxal phosphate-dependent enzyme [Planctomycetota bacterium]MCP4862192.1 aminotransferase class III-fold pyridoxal phosphate-dependent enzyme [Planctomycetota bacterium]
MPLSQSDSELRDFYAQKARPRLAEVLNSIGLDVVYRRGHGPYLEYQKDGETIEVLDFLAGYGAGLLGHNHPALVEVAQANLDEQVPTHTQASTRGWAGALCNELNQVLHRSMGRDYIVHLLNTGTEAVEAAVQHCELARRTRLNSIEIETECVWRTMAEEMESRSADEQEEFLKAAVELDPSLAGLRDLNSLMLQVSESNREAAAAEPIFLALEGGYHGSGSAAGKLSYGKRNHSTLSSTGISVGFVPADDLQALEEVIEENTVVMIEPSRSSDGGWSPRKVQVHCIAAFFMEVIQGEGGILVLKKEGLQELHSICRDHRIPLIADEIQTGLGRTGALFACEDAGLQPEIVLISKVLGGGLAKVAAMAIAREEYVNEFSLMHSSTFAEDDPSSRIALAVVELLTRNDGELVKRSAYLGEVFLAGLKKIQERWPTALADVRGRGLMLGIEFASMNWNPSATIRGFDAGGALAAVASGWLLHEANIRVAPALRHPRTLRLQPPVLVTEDDIQHALDSIDRLCGFLANGDAIALTRFLHGSETKVSQPNGDDLLARVPPPDMDVGTSYAAGHYESPSGLPRVAFFSHFIDSESVRDWDRCLSDLSNEDASHLISRMEGWSCHFPMRRFRLRSLTGKEVEGVVFGWPIMPEGYISALRDRRKYTRMVDDIREALLEATEEGCKWVGFGGFTSILTRSCTAVRNEEIRVTSGNSLTAGMAAAAVVRSCRESGMDLSKETVAVVGAAGNLGRIQAHLLKAEAGRILLVGKPGSEKRLERIVAELIEEDELGAEVEITTDISRLAECRVIVTASNSTKPIVYPEHVAEDVATVFLDISVPGDAAPGLEEARPKMSYIRGGIVRLPNGMAESRLQLPGWHLPDGHAYACLAETILLGLEELDSDYSCGPVNPARVRHIMELAAKHGFELGSYQLRPSL